MSWAAFHACQAGPPLTEEVSAVMRYANDHHIPVVPRGSGWGLSAVLGRRRGRNLRSLRNEPNFRTDERKPHVTVEPGVLLMELAAFAEATTFYPPDPVKSPPPSRAIFPRTRVACVPLNTA